MTHTKAVGLTLLAALLTATATAPARGGILNGLDSYGNVQGTMTLSGGEQAYTVGDVTLDQGSKIYLHLNAGEATKTERVTSIEMTGSLHLNASAWPSKNAHALNLLADIFLADGTYSPVICANSLTEGVAAFGGTWDGVAKTFTASTVSAHAAGDVVTLTSGGRYRFTDSRDGCVLGVSVADAGPDASILVNSGEWAAFGALRPLVEELGEQDRPADLLAFWQVDVAGVDELYYSLDIGPGQEHLTLFLYTLEDGWLEYSADILEWGSVTYDDESGVLGFVAPSATTMIAVFGVNPFYYVQSAPPTPEPATLSLLTLGGAILLRRRR